MSLLFANQSFMVLSRDNGTVFNDELSDFHFTYRRHDEKFYIQVYVLRNSFDVHLIYNAHQNSTTHYIQVGYYVRM